MFTGVQFGAILAMVVGGWVCSTEFLGGWPSVFYVFGALSLVWGIFWFLLVRDRPEEHPRVSTDELTYIKTNMGQVTSKKVLV